MDEEKYFAIPALVESHEEVREVITWGNRGKDNKQEVEHVKLKDMGSDHLLNILHTQGMLSRDIAYNIVTELYYRIDKLEETNSELRGSL